MDTALRRPAVAGRFYPADASSLRAEVETYLGAPYQEARSAVALLAPHAGYVFSGTTAGAAYARVQVPTRVVVLCPNHTGLGAQRSIWPSGSWQLPGEAVDIESKLASRIRDEARLTADTQAHWQEHAIEVQLPFLLARQANLHFVPICLAHLSFAECREVGEGLARVIAATPSPVLIVVSTDMSHYISADSARRLDHLALDRVLALDAEGLYATVKQQGISMCGYIPTTVALLAAVALGARRAELTHYAHSGQVSGDYDHVVGYASVVID